MLLVRFALKNKIKYGMLTDDTIKSYKGNPFNSSEVKLNKLKFDGESYKLGDVRLLAPCTPSKVACLGLNYRPHADEVQMNLPKLPLLFMKPSTAVIGPEDEIIFPADYTRVDYEAELAVVIGKKAKLVTEDKVNDYILGYTCFNDVTERDQQSADGQWTRSKSYDTFAPIGPYIETDVDGSSLQVELFLNGEKKQSGNTRDLLFNIPRLVSFISGVMTLLPGDVIATGTPPGIAPMKPGDIVEVKIEKIGTLRNSTTVQK
jgi:2-keto-4-pentenoate hydratase/2-oxohepta-3-ene-1,7-dioic acid hydratase in catechol pathway